MIPDCLNFPNLKQFLDRFEELLRIAAYMKSSRSMAVPINNKHAQFGAKSCIKLSSLCMGSYNSVLCIFSNNREPRYSFTFNVYPTQNSHTKEANQTFCVKNEHN